uniref:Uncharacterized protein n=1 Tax=Arundo donax TaxID=35708 RepID=A0A0A9HHT3_ARUDO
MPGWIFTMQMEHKSKCCISTLSSMYSRPLAQHLIVSHDTI